MCGTVSHGKRHRAAGLGVLSSGGKGRAGFGCPVLIQLLLVCRRASRARRGSRAASAGEVGADDTGTCSGSEGSADPMSTGSEFLDKALVLHLHNCNHLLLVRLGTGTRCGDTWWGWPRLPAGSGMQ